MLSKVNLSTLGLSNSVFTRTSSDPVTIQRLRAQDLRKTNSPTITLNSGIVFAHEPSMVQCYRWEKPAGFINSEATLVEL